ncbi:MAG: hypothetical protein ACE5L6_04055 [Candidatus Bathyarchaeia archaeon]
MALQTLRLRSIVVAIVCGLLLSLATGLVENPPDGSIIGYRSYGYPLVWRVTKTLQPTEYGWTSLALDTAFWIAVSLLVVIIVELLKLRVGLRYETFLLPLLLLIPLGLVMDFVHEFGHAIWGAAVGGRLTYMQIAYFQLHPRFAITSQFVLGCVRVDGLTTRFASGLMQLGGSLTTNIVSWLLALILLKTSLGHKTQVALRILGLFGLLDLPFYVLFPQIGLRHWIFLGGCHAEPLIGARNMGISDQAFYIMVVLTTLGLIFFYFKPLWKKVEERLRDFSD